MKKVNEMSDRELIFEVAARIVATPQNIPVSSDSAIGAAKTIIAEVRKNPDRSPHTVESTSLFAAAVFAARTPNNNGPENVASAVDAITGLLSALA